MCVCAHDETVFAPELPLISYPLWPPGPLSGAALSARQTVAALRTVVHGRGSRQHRGAVCVGQSMGTAVIAWMLKADAADRHRGAAAAVAAADGGGGGGGYCSAAAMPRPLVGAALLMDPICFLLHEPALCHNFLYKEVTGASDQLMRYLMGDELNVRIFMQRCFHWADAALFLEELPEAMVREGRIAVALGAADSLVDARAVRRYLLGLNAQQRAPRAGAGVAGDEEEGGRRGAAAAAAFVPPLALPPGSVMVAAGTDHGGSMQNEECKAGAARFFARWSRMGSG
eukprot:COSAG01_NODE_6762_length_3510_cov_2.850777_3_plen_286_part_00